VAVVDAGLTGTLAARPPENEAQGRGKKKTIREERKNNVLWGRGGWIGPTSTHNFWWPKERGGAKAGVKSKAEKDREILDW